MKILVSACLLGIDCKYNGKNNKNDKIIELLKDHELIPVCPEILGGLPTPRIPAEIHQNKVIAKDGKDVTKQYQKGAEETLKIAKLYNCHTAILKEKSPSCGCGKVYDGTFTGTLINGDGITARLLKEHGIKITGETTFFDYAICRRKKQPDVRKKEKWKPYLDYVLKEQEWLKEHQEQELKEIRSKDGLTLRAAYIPRENAKGTIICMHGYHSTNDIEFVPEVRFLWNLGYSILLPWQRSHGKSEGRYITYGVKERHDLKRWILYTNRHLAAKNKDIFLCGISMGCATTLMAAGLDLPDNVKGIIADCGFTSPWDIIKHVAKERFHLPPFPLMYMVDLISEVVAGFGLKEVSIPEIMKRNKIPVLFIHGDADDYVPMWMTIKNYEACAAKKELYIVSGAGHALAFSKDMEEGKRRIKNFINKYKTI